MKTVGRLGGWPVRCAAAAFLTALSKAPAFGWGSGGHEIVAVIAYGRLHRPAKAEVDRLLAIPVSPAGKPEPTDPAKRFMHAYRKARAWLIMTAAAKVAESESAFFPEIDRAVLTSTIAYYQKLGCWTPHVEITRPAFEVALDVFQHSGLITKRHRYEDVVAQPPDAA